jgi:hypothetical protein
LFEFVPVAELYSVVVADFDISIANIPKFGLTQQLLVLPRPV